MGDDDDGEPDVEDDSPATSTNPPVQDVSEVDPKLRAPTTPIRPSQGSRNGRSSPAVSTTPSSSRIRRSGPTPRRKVVSRRSVASPTVSSSRPSAPSYSQPARSFSTSRPRPGLGETLTLWLTPLSLIVRPFGLVLPALLFHALNTLILSFLGITIVSLLLTGASHLVTHLLRSFVTSIGLGWLLPSTETQYLTDVSLPLRAVATSSCSLLGVMCSLSAWSTKQGNVTSVAQPWWRLRTAEIEEEQTRLDVATVARSLAEEARGARDIFDSVRLLGDGGLVRGLEYLKVWELGVAVQVSNLDDKEILGRQLIELGDLSRDLTDEVVSIDAMSVNSFSWLQWEFARLVQMLSMPDDVRPSSTKLQKHLHSLLIRLQSTLDTLHSLTAQSVSHATHASSHGQHLLHRLFETRHELEHQRSLSPAWRRVLDRGTHLMVGGEPTKSEMLERDLILTRETISNLGGLRLQLEETRQQVKRFRDQVGVFGASMMGFHLGASEEGGLGPEEEVRVLAGVVEELGTAVGRAKERPLALREGLKRLGE
ncbi:hypothetical protein M231_04305 [Tremella mesenterica]|uniref:Uncharacterized protein n=1 Tax=Tremella mesenterica TaxID=5217 RepID=A0A4Q1BL00_TREME|nr:hypothetical protein M231_04305 [Tremella mesenterica]